MLVVSVGLDTDSRDRLVEACARNTLPLLHAPADGPVPLDDDLLAVFCGPLDSASLDPAEIRRHGAYVVRVHDELSSSGVLAAMRAGYDFVFASPLGVDRIASFLGYLREVAAPPGTAIVTLDEAGSLSTRAGTVMLEPAEAAALRLFGDRTGRIISREELVEATSGADPLRTTESLRQHLRRLDSGARILKVPHMGFRFSGTVRPAVSPSRPPSPAPR
ncbi:winged helix-turn-helix domain-containing protein [Streptomyces scabiei]|uniref:winged helix-turn-helix domain-containing protein n=1 Tax=Streptomyces TaxID=1883 RepID=UPI0029A4029B|nr:winged helix-turn-helix domain-containing protein [Streptomyces scabiei]MDX3115178.1 winged helix-turn-helix domain-containing protein [Streptomyces scabiei]